MQSITISYSIDWSHADSRRAGAAGDRRRRRVTEKRGRILRSDWNPEWSFLFYGRTPIKAWKRNRAGEFLPPQHLATLILAFSQREKESIYYLSELTT